MASGPQRGAGSPKLPFPTGECQGHASSGQRTWWRHTGLLRMRYIPFSSPSGKTRLFIVHWEKTAAVEEIPLHAVVRVNACEAG